jgi:ribose transport system permease protein
MSTPQSAIGLSLISRIPGVAVVLAVLIAYFGTASAHFLSVGNISNILVQSTILLLVALPMTLIIMTEGLDLSAGAVLTFASIILASVSIATGSVWTGILVGLGAGLAFGILNGSLIAFLGIPPFIVTLGTLGVAQGLSLVVTDGQSVVGIPETIAQLYSAGPLGIPLPIIFSVLAYALFHVLLYHTQFGTYIFALGGNREALRLAGVSDRKILIAVYALGGLMVGFAALLMTARMNAAHPTAAIGMEFDAIAAVAVGGTSFERGDGWLLGTLLGVLAVGVLRNGLNLLAVPSSVQVACIGGLVLAALLIDGLRSRK